MENLRLIGNAKLMLIAVMICGISSRLNAQAKITDGSVLTLDANSLLELESANKGLLIPRMAINNVNLPAPLTAPVPAGMLVYSSGGTVTDGFYFWNGTLWKRFVLATVQVNEGGTGLTSGTSGGIPAFTGVTTISSSGVLAQNALIVGGGAGATPATLPIGNANQVLAVNSTATGYTHRSIKQQIGTWGIQNLARGVTSSPLIIVAVGGTSMSASGSRIKMAFGGTVVGVVISGSAACTAGTATFTVFKNDAATTASAIISTTNPQFVYTNTNSVAFIAGDILDIRVTTTPNPGGFTPSGSTEYVAWIIIQWTE